MYVYSQIRTEQMNKLRPIRMATRGHSAGEFTTSVVCSETGLKQVDWVRNETVAPRQLADCSPFVE